MAIADDLNTIVVNAHVGLLEQFKDYATKKYFNAVRDADPQATIDKWYDIADLLQTTIDADAGTWDVGNTQTEINQLFIKHLDLIP